MIDAEHREHIEQLIERRNELTLLARSYDPLMNEIAVMATEAMGLLIEVVEQIPPESWDQPSNLDGWSMRDLVGHVTGNAAKIVTLVEGGRFGKRLRNRPTGKVRTRPHDFASWPPGCRTPCPARTWTRCGLRRRAWSLCTGR